MKTTKVFIAAAAALAALLAGVSSGRAQQLYPAFVSAVSVSTNSSGLTYRFFGNRDIIRNCAHEAGLTNLQGLALVYNRTADALDVVSGTNKTVICTPAMFSGGQSLSNTNGTQIQRLTFVHWEGSTAANGTMVAHERSFTGTNGVTCFKLNGQLQFAVPGSSTNSPTIYIGNLAAGNDLFDEFSGE